MARNRRVSIASAITLIAFGVAVPAAIAPLPAGAATTTVVVGPGDLAPNGSWTSPPGGDTGTLGFVNGPGTPPAGTGSVAISVASTLQHRQLYNYSYGICAVGPDCAEPGTDLSSISSLGYSTYRDPSSTQANAVPDFTIEIDPDSTTGAGVDYATLLWEPVSNGGTVTDSTWQTWDPYDAGNGLWYSTADLSAYGVLACAPLTCTATWDDIVDALPDGIVKYGVGVNAGANWTSFAGNVDRLVVGIDGDDTVYDFEQEPRLAVGDASIHEGDTGKRLMRFMVNLDRIAPAGGVKVSWIATPGTATSADFKALAGRLTFKSKQTTRYIKINVKPDALTEGDEQFTITLFSATGGIIEDSTGIGTIVDDEATTGPVLSIGDASVSEGGSGGSRYVFLPITLNQPVTGPPATVTYATSAGSATAPDDYTARALALTISPKARVGYALVYLAADGFAEGDETFTVTLSSPVNATIADGTATVTITDDD